MKPTPTPQQVAREIKRRNLAFTKATPAQKRVLLAKDVIAQIRAKLFKVTTGDWVKIPMVDSYQKGTDSDVSLQQALLNRTIPTCEVCALGGLMTSCVLYENQVTLGDYRTRALELDGNEVGLDELFTKEQKRLIELAFEGNGGWFANVAYDDAHDRYPDEYPRNRRSAKLDATLFSPLECQAISWKHRIPGKTKRLVAIMRNIVRNAGDFKP